MEGFECFSVRENPSVNGPEAVLEPSASETSVDAAKARV